MSKTKYAPTRLPLFEGSEKELEHVDPLQFIITRAVPENMLATMFIESHTLHGAQFIANEVQYAFNYSHMLPVDKQKKHAPEEWAYAIAQSPILCQLSMRGSQ